MFQKPRRYAAFAISLTLLLAFNAPAQTSGADEEAPVAAPMTSPVRPEPTVREAPVAEPRERAPSPAIVERAPLPAAVDTPAPSESRVESPAPRADVPVREFRPASPAPRVAVAPEPANEPAAVASPTPQPEKERAVTRKPAPTTALAMRTPKAAKSDSAATATVTPIAEEAAPVATPMPELAAIAPAASYAGATEQSPLSRAPTGVPVQSPVLVLQALPEDKTSSVKVEMASLTYMWIALLALLIAGLGYLGWRLFRYTEWHLPPGH